MNIKKFNEFSLENKYAELEKEHGSFGQYVENIENMFKDDTERMERFRQIVGKYLEDCEVDPQIRLSNATNTLDEIDQRLLVKELKREFNISEDLISQEIDTESEVRKDLSNIKDMRLSGKFGFNSFLKVITALNLPDIKPDYGNCPDDFSIIYIFNNLDKNRLVNIMKRFKSLEFATKIINDSSDNKIGLYFGLKYNKKFYMEYGLIIDDKRSICGDFSFGKTQLSKILLHRSKSLNSFKELMRDSDLYKMKILMKVKYDLDTFSPGYFHKKGTPKITGDVLTASYYGVGNWNKGMLDRESYKNMKCEFNDWILNKKWKKSVTYSVKPGKFWVYFKIKAK